ncbi:hypothetical protein GF336_02555 [Candidatus Woesearchaeota archaeon]|nr:hypothetical protein [Candidatus Woesearchaeota archaeon]
MKIWFLLGILLLAGCEVKTGNVDTVYSEDGEIEDVFFCPRDDCGKELEEFILSAEESVHCALFDLDLENVIDALKLKSKSIDVKLVVDDRNWEYVSSLDFAINDTSSQLSHNKFCVVDSKRVSTGSFNPTENGNSKNNNNMIILKSDYISENHEEEFSELWGRSFGKGRNVEYPVVYLDGMEVENYFCPEDRCSEMVVEEIKKAEDSVYFMTFSFTHESIANNILLKKDNITIKGIFENVGAGSKYSKFNVFDYQGMDVRRDNNSGAMHHKVFIIDNSTVITGSFNPSKSADTRNDENILIIHDRGVAAKYLDEFEHVWENYTY